MELFEGRPNDNTDRLPKEIRTYDFLDRLKIKYWRVDHEAAMTMEDCEKADAAMGTRMCKNLFLCNRQQTDFYLLMIPGDKAFKTKDISAQIESSRLSFGSAEHMEALLDITPGSLSVLGLINDKECRVQLLIDEDVLCDEYIGCHPCINTASLKIKTSDLLEKIIPETAHTPIIVKL
jgi:Ala-tRNA(Pro) deacylase